jgi:hypothetical protein
MIAVTSFMALLCLWVGNAYIMGGCGNLANKAFTQA